MSTGVFGEDVLKEMCVKLGGLTIQNVRQVDNSISLLCHSVSAGVGRTGTFLALDYLLDQAKAEQLVDILFCVNLLRERRIKMVQTLVCI